MLENVATARLIPILAKLFRVEIFPPGTGSFPRSSLLSSTRSMPGSSPVGFYKTNVLDLVKTLEQNQAHIKSREYTRGSLDEGIAITWVKIVTQAR